MRIIHIKTEFEGFHQYTKAPEEVKFLRNLHRHIFKVEVEIVVGDEDREIEFFMLKKDVDLIIKNKVSKLDKNRSCEAISECILDWLETKYANSPIQVSTFEDGECGARVSNVERFQSLNE